MDSSEKTFRQLTWFEKICHDNPWNKRLALVDSRLPSKNGRFQPRCSVTYTCSVNHDVLNVVMGSRGTRRDVTCGRWRDVFTRPWSDHVSALARSNSDISVFPCGFVFGAPCRARQDLVIVKVTVQIFSQKNANIFLKTDFRISIYGIVFIFVYVLDLKARGV